jgi:aryl-alcohol dehydrogenase-like predicted oxidoreductase
MSALKSEKKIREKMNYRLLGRTGLLVSEIGFGSWGIGGKMWADSDDRESIKALHRAIELGVNFIDTALVYGDGHSERLIGQVLKETKENVYVATKIPPKNMVWPALKGIPLKEVFPYEHIINSTEKSLKNLGVDTIDLQQFHVWNDEWALRDEWWEAIQKLKEDGKIRFFGVSINDHEPWNAIQLIKTGRVDTVQVIYNIFDQSPEDELFPICIEYNIGVIVRVPFDEGSLTGKITPETQFPEGDWRNRYFKGDRKQQVWERVQKLEKLLGEEAKTLSELALRFCLSHEAVSTVIPGMRKVEHVEENCSVSDGRKLSDRMLLELRKHRWVRNFYR